ncbi:MAG: tyrosine-type recombinase/integrase [Blastocatellia bacterium]|nr:tyrosine-type recombinase/integrase [Blastocatellia bacterium]
MCEAANLELGQFIRWLTYSGLRLSGAAGIRWDDIDFSAGEYRRKMKGGKVVVIPLLPDALSLSLAEAFPSCRKSENWPRFLFG